MADRGFRPSLIQRIEQASRELKKSAADGTTQIIACVIGSVLMIVLGPLLLLLWHFWAAR